MCKLKNTFSFQNNMSLNLTMEIVLGNQKEAAGLAHFKHSVLH